MNPIALKLALNNWGFIHLLKNPNDVTMIFEASGIDVMNTYMSDPRLQEDMKNGGVISAPVVSVLNKV